MVLFYLFLFPVKGVKFILQDKATAMTGVILPADVD
ncbi:hypothetical protein NIASO_09335 [Niabella soli DSM 19437]|uniref:Uncharacterized protein n=1 Tax=Niabella soli DSM 19437 TaxID=929713 RepID=W0F3A8_9BACT|nr:hypothetical protein NIASO_09335 [Niabella soli DSM 19437]